ncbi:hypothetical protein HP546_29365 [Pseudomonas sp. CM25]|nr:hypothetical protein [Pseudomonas sp. CM25]
MVPIDRPAICAAMAKLCEVDLRPGIFPIGAVAQTSAARVNVIIVNTGTSGLQKF